MMLRKKGTTEVFPYTDLLAKRSDMEAYDPEAPEIAKVEVLVAEDEKAEESAKEELVQAQAAETNAEEDLAAVEHEAEVLKGM